MFGWFKKEKFRPQNGFAGLVHVPTEVQIKHQKLKHPMGKLECYIFYSTYISVLTSCIHPRYVDMVDQLLVNGIWSYRKFLKIGESDFILGFPHYVESRGKLYMDCIKEILENFNGRDGATIPTFVMMFETKEYKDLDEVDVSDLFHIMEAFQTVKLNLELIHQGYNLSAELEKMTVNVNPEVFISAGTTIIDDLVVLPFRKPICEQCGSVKNRSDLEAVATHTEHGSFLMPVCLDCKAKYAGEDGSIMDI
jgi:hypothetical protein